MEKGVSLFLHWGPGGNATTEKHWFGDSVAVDWWDQPKPSASVGTDGTRALNDLFDAAVEKLTDLARRQGGPVPIVAHCFGARIATELAQRAPQFIQSMTFLSAGARPPRGFLRLAERLATLEGAQAPDSHRLRALREKLADAQIALTPASFWSLFETITADPAFFGHYWGNAETRDRYLGMQTAAPVEPQAFQTLMNGLLEDDTRRQLVPLTGAAGIPVHVVIGSQDPLVSLASERIEWTRLFPHATFSEVPGAGHFVHFEAPQMAGF